MKNPPHLTVFETPPPLPSSNIHTLTTNPPLTQNEKLNQKSDLKNAHANANANANSPLLKVSHPSLFPHKKPSPQQDSKATMIDTEHCTRLGNR